MSGDGPCGYAAQKALRGSACKLGGQAVATAQKQPRAQFPRACGVRDQGGTRRAAFQERVGQEGGLAGPCPHVDARSSLQAGGRCPGMAGPTSCDHTHGLEPRSAGGTTEHRFASSALRPPQGPWGQGCPHSARWALGLSPEAELFLVWGGGGCLVAKSCPTLATP